jgi:hypothetical protein
MTLTSGSTRPWPSRKREADVKPAGIVTALLAAALMLGSSSVADAAPALAWAVSQANSSGPLAASGRYRVISVPGATQTMPEDVTDAGVIVGCFTARHHPLHGFTDRGGRFRTITDPAGRSIALCVLGVNARGVMVGYYVSRSGVQRGFRDVRGRFTSISVPGASGGTVAVDINDSGVVVGYYFRRGAEHGFVLRRGKFTMVRDPAAGRSARGFWVSGISDAGTLAGGYISRRGVLHGYVDHGGAFTPLDVRGAARAPRKGTAPECLSKHTGLVVGSFWRRGPYPIGFSYQDGTYRTLSEPAATEGTSPQCANDAGQIVGIFYGRHGVQHGFEFTPSRSG